MVVPPLITTAEPWALRKPSAEATIVYVPPGAVRLKVPSTLEGTDVAIELSGLYKRMVIALLAKTCPLSKPEVGIGVTVGVFPRTVMISAMDAMLSRELTPCETRAVHSMPVWPICIPVTLNVKAVPLAVALLLPLPAIATMKTPFCGPLIAETVSVPKRLEIVMLLDSIRLGL